jgi:hypothetical protein
MNWDNYEKARKIVTQADRLAGNALAEDYPLTMAAVGIGYALLAVADTLAGQAGNTQEEGT